MPEKNGIDGDGRDKVEGDVALVAPTFTGERFIPGQGDSRIEAEHRQRYQAVAPLARGRRVLDAACGEGYGSALLAAEADSVVGIDIAPESVKWSAGQYRRDNLVFRQASITDLPFGDASFDLVVSFETIEHVGEKQQEQFMSEIRRTLTADGVLVISTPEKFAYNQANASANVYHVREFLRDEFLAFLRRYFPCVTLYRQGWQDGRYALGLVPDEPGKPGFSVVLKSSQPGLENWPCLYLVAVCSLTPPPPLDPSLCLAGHPWTTTTLFLDYGDGYSEDHKVVVRPEFDPRSGCFVVRFQLPTGPGPVRRLRWDPCEGHYCRCHLDGVVTDGACLNAEGLNASHCQDGWMEFLTLDPMVELSGGWIHATHMTLTGIMEFSVVAQQKDEIQYLKDRTLHLQAQLEQSQSACAWQATAHDEWKKTAMSLRASWSWRVTGPLRWLAALARPSEAKPSRVGILIRSMWAFYRLNGLRQGSATLCEAMGRGGVKEVALHWRAFIRESPVTSNKPPVELDQARNLMRREMKAAFDRFMDSGECLGFVDPPVPRVTVLLVLWNQAELTLGCLRAVQKLEPESVEVLVVDNASTDRTPELLERLKGVRIIRNGENLGFVLAVNQGAEQARGRYLWLLNNDAYARPDCLAHLVATLESEDDIGAVGGRVILPNGMLQEAGSLVWQDGSCLGYGRNGDPWAGEFMFRRDVDFCSGVCLLTRRDLFLEMGGFDEQFAPAYYEETDFCLRLREKGLRVVYEPQAVVDHYEYGSARGQEAPSGRMRKNQAVLVSKHKPLLEARRPYSAGQIIRARTTSPCRGRILYVDDRVPLCQWGSGFPRAQAIVHALRGQGWFVTLYAAHGAPTWEEIRRELSPDIEVLMAGSGLPLHKLLEDRKDYYDILWVSRPTNMAFVKKLKQENPGLFEGMRLIYDAEAIWATRDIGQAEVRGRPLGRTTAEARINGEMALAQGVDTVVAVSERDAAVFREAGCRKVEVVAHAVVADPAQTPFEEREGVLFVGYLGVEGSPNVDAVSWFAEKILPGLSARIGRPVPFFVVGGDAGRALKKIGKQTPGMRLIGSIHDLTPWYSRARIFVAPTRFGAGVPLKVYEAAAVGVPVVGTSLLAQQTGWRDGVDWLVGADADGYIHQCSRLYGDAPLWTRLRENALQRIRGEHSPEALALKISGILEETHGLNFNGSLS